MAARATLVCLRCGGKNPMDCEACRFCGDDFGAGSLPLRADRAGPHARIIDQSYPGQGGHVPWQAGQQAAVQAGMPDGSVSCPSCHNQNREWARYCDYCGAKLPDVGGLDDLDGKDFWPDSGDPRMPSSVYDQAKAAAGGYDVQDGYTSSSGRRWDGRERYEFLTSPDRLDPDPRAPFGYEEPSSIERLARSDQRVAQLQRELNEAERFAHKAGLAAPSAEAQQTGLLRPDEHEAIGVWADAERRAGMVREKLAREQAYRNRLLVDYDRAAISNYEPGREHD